MVNAINPSASPVNATSIILIPLPDHDFDPTEASIPWEKIHSLGWKVDFSTERGAVAETDLNRLKGPGLFSASTKVQATYQRMTEDSSYQHPIPYAEIEPSKYDALVLPGGDALRMRQYLDSTVLQAKVLQFWQQGKLIGAICHGMLVLARTIDPATGHSVLYGRKVTVLPKSLDQAVYFINSKLRKLGYVRYDKWVADEIRACLEKPDDFSSGPGLLAPYVVQDGNLITSRYYTDAEVFGDRFIKALGERLSRQ